MKLNCSLLLMIALTTVVIATALNQMIEQCLICVFSFDGE